ncbi:Mrd1p [Paramicrosporidium saccamoebae]|uniref:Mrd1p n=1 Tax=Paramicrosporidium saccamoebae TaxID=1246581 RepID=A0A2H9TKI5_9FUNG|nr:Mrd1p [Paramicrosporidium saccamoebae]
MRPVPATPADLGRTSSYDDRRGREADHSRHHGGRDRDRDRERDRERGRERESHREPYRESHREPYRESHRDRDRDRDRRDRDRHDGRERRYDDRERRRSRSRDDRRGRDYERDNGRYFRDGGNGRRRDKSPIALFDKYSVENLSPYRGVALPLEERQRVLKNWDAAPAGFERITADKAKLTGLFPPPGNIAKITNFVPPTLDPTKAAMLAMLTNTTPDTASYLSSGAALFAPALSKQARRVYVGEIPKNATEDEIADFFNQRMAANQSSTAGIYVLGVEIAGDRDYAFVDLRSPEEAELATKLDGEHFRGHQIIVRRTREYQTVSNGGPETQAEPSENNQLVISGIPKFLTEAHLKYLLAPFGQIKFLRVLHDESLGTETFGVAVLELDDPAVVEPMRKGLDGFDLGEHRLVVRKLPDCVDDEQVALALSLFSLTPGKATTDPSLVMQLLNMVTTDDLTNDQDYEDIIADIREECEQYGDIVTIHVPRPSLEHRVAGIGKIFVEFRKVEDCMRAVSELSGRLFADRAVLSSYFPLEKFHQRIL